MYDFSSKEEQLPSSSFKNITLQKDTNYIFIIIFFVIIVFYYFISLLGRWQIAADGRK
jgi:hypothetical protein